MSARTARQPRIAIVSPWPPQGSGVADYASRIASSLSVDYDIDAYHDPVIRPDVDDFATPIASPLLPRLRPLRSYRNILYQMGNSPTHAFLYRNMLAHPGVVTIHDPRLTHFHEAYGERPEVEPGHLAREIARERPRDARAIVARLPAMRRSPGGVGGGLIARGLDLNRHIVEQSRAVVVHSKWAADRMRALVPEHADKVHHIPFGVVAEQATTDQRIAMRDRLGLPRDALIFASLGFLAPGKMNEEAITAFTAVARDEPSSLFVFMGTDLNEGKAERTARSLGIADRVRFLGRRSDQDFRDLAASCDVGVNLRRPPTNGETSAALLDLMRWGTPTIINDADAFNDEPEYTVARVRWAECGIAGLLATMTRLARDASHRYQLARSAHDHIRTNHRPSDATSLYVDLIEATATQRLREAI